jgi:hypothetical protein
MSLSRLGLEMCLVSGVPHAAGQLLNQARFTWIQLGSRGSSPRFARSCSSSSLRFMGFMIFARISARQAMAATSQSSAVPNPKPDLRAIVMSSPPDTNSTTDVDRVSVLVGSGGKSNFSIGLQY